MLKKLGGLLLVSSLCFLLTACGSQQGKQKADPGKLQVVATNFAGYDWAKQVGGDRVQVRLLVPPGMEVHHYEPTPKDVKTLTNADVFVCVGGESEAWVNKLKNNIKPEKTRVVEMLELVKPVREELKEGMQVSKEEEQHAGEDEAEYDEHVWTSPANAIVVAEAISQAFTAKDAAGAELYAANNKKLSAELTALDQEFAAVVQQGKRRVLIFGDRFPFRYFADRYQLDYYAAFPGCEHATEPSATTLTFLIKKVQEEKVPVVLHTELSSEKIADIICEATGAQKREFNACHNVTKEQLQAGETYCSLMRKNVPVLKEALN